jgi:hypothetical protein
LHHQSEQTNVTLHHQSKQTNVTLHHQSEQTISYSVLFIKLPCAISAYRY